MIDQALARFLEDPRSDLTCFDLATQYRCRHYHAAAVTFYMRSQALSDDPVRRALCFINAADCLIKVGDRAATVEWMLDEALAEQPESARAHELYALHYSHQARKSSAPRHEWARVFGHASTGLAFVQSNESYVETNLKLLRVQGAWGMGRTQQAEQEILEVYNTVEPQSMPSRRLIELMQEMKL